jgi:hypothetical protein
MKKISALILAATLLSPAAKSASESEQDDAYFKCLIARKAFTVVTPEDKKACNEAAGVVDVGDAERKKRLDALRECFLDQIVRLDDEISPVMDIARIAARGCANEYSNWVESLALFPRAKREMAKTLDTTGVDIAAPDVLSVRRYRRTKRESR